MGGISINNNIISPVDSCEGTQDNNKKESKSSLDFGQMIFDNIRRERNLSQQKKEAEEEKQEKEEKPDPAKFLHQQYMMMGDYISSFKKKEEKK